MNPKIIVACMVAGIFICLGMAILMSVRDKAPVNKFPNVIQTMPNLR